MTWQCQYRRDPDTVLAALTDLGIIVPMADTLSLRRAIAFGLDNLLNKVRHNLYPQPPQDQHVLGGVSVAACHYLKEM